MIQKFLYLFVILLGPGLQLQAAESTLTPPLANWLDAQTNIQTWSADFVQTRTLKAMVQPLTATGHVWFAAPNRFHWELGDPPRTIAVRAPESLLIFYPKLKRVERFALSGNQTGPWRDALALLEAGFPRNQADLLNTYSIISQNVTGEVAKLVLQPKSEAARRMMPQIEIDFDTKTSALRATELTFADGSTMRNDFKNPVLNPKLDPKMFEPEIPKDYKVVEPLKRS